MPPFLRLPALAAAAGTLAASAGCEPAGNQFVPPPPPEVQVARPVARKVQPYFKVTGITEARRTVEIRPRVAGHIVDTPFTDGQRVVGSKSKPDADGRFPVDAPESDRGTLLFVIDPRPYQAAVDQAKAQLALKQAVAELARVELKKKEDALAKNAIAELEVIRQRAEAARASADSDAAAAALRSAELDLSYTRIYAPIDGRVSRTNVNRGDLVGPAGAAPLATVVQDQPIYAFYNASDREVITTLRKMGRKRPDATTGPEIPVDLGLDDEPDYPHKGRFDYADPQVDPNTGTYRFRAIFDNADGLLVPGLYVKLRVKLFDAADALLVPDRAVGVDQTGRFVLVVGPDDVVEQRSVVTGELEDDGLRVILKGLSAEDTVIVNGLQRARPGGKVVPKPAAADAPPAATKTEPAKKG